MNDDGLRKVRVFLIQLAKSLPFIVCAIVLISFIECAFALATNDIIMYDGYAILNKPISWAIGKYCEYNFQMLFVLVVLSFAMRTCIYNKLACLYLFVNLLEKSHFATYEYDNNIYYIVIAINIVVAMYFTYIGTKILIKPK